MLDSLVQGLRLIDLGEMDSAVLYFREAAWQAGTDELRAEALYNLEPPQKVKL